METKRKVLFASFEATPFLQTGGLGDVAGALPAALRGEGVDCRLIMPKFGTIPEEYRAKMKHVTDFYMPLAWRSQYVGIESLRKGNVTCYFIDNEYYFRRESAYGFFDDGERIAFFARAVVEAAGRLGSFVPEILHCNDWHTAMAPVFLKTLYKDDPVRNRIRTLFTIHNLKFQGMYSDYLVGDILGLSRGEAGYCGLLMGDAVNFMRGALCMSDRISTVSPTYAGEICNSFFGEGLDDVLNSRRGVLSGILNGIDVKRYDPRTDKNLPAHYDRTDPAKKAEVKRCLQAELGLEQRPDVPLCVIVSRLTEQKGLDLLLGVFSELLELDIQFAVLGVGDHKYEDAFRWAQGAYPGKMAAVLRFDEGLSHRFYAGADIALVPSLFEPCGLSQMIAMHYGTLPLVRETGGLRDSVIPYNKFTDEGTGFSFCNYNAHELLFTLKNAVALYKGDRPAWDRMVLRAMDADFSWTASAKQYAALYDDIMKG